MSDQELMEKLIAGYRKANAAYRRRRSLVKQVDESSKKHRELCHTLENADTELREAQCDWEENLRDVLELEIKNDI